MPAKYKFTYFGVRARGEIPRLVFAAAKKEYEYVEVTFEQWPQLKAQTPPFGALPVLEVDGKPHGQSMAISVFLASEFGLMGKTNMDKFIIEQMLHLREDMIGAEAKHFLEQDAATKAELFKKLEECYPTFMGQFETMLKSNGGGSGFAVGTALSLGDLVLYGALTTALKNCPKIIEKFPVLIAHRARIAKLDGIKQYLAALPDSPM